MEESFANLVRHRNRLSLNDCHRLIFEGIINSEHYFFIAEYFLAKVDCRLPVLPTGCNDEVIAKVFTWPFRQFSLKRTLVLGRDVLEAAVRAFQVIWNSFAKMPKNNLQPRMFLEQSGDNKSQCVGD